MSVLRNNIAFRRKPRIISSFTQRGSNMLSLDNVKSFLNEKTDYLINWNRVGNLFFSNHRYSSQELMERGFVVTCTAAGGFLAWNKSEEGGVTPFALGASLAFLLSHTVIISPLIYKRLKAKWSCDEHIKTINSKLSEEDKDFTLLVKQVIDKVMTHAAEKSPSAIWGKRERLLKNLETWIDEEDHSMLDGVLKNEEIIPLLDKGSFPRTESFMIKSL